jgi:hypothetical protein
MQEFVKLLLVSSLTLPLIARAEQQAQKPAANSAESPAQPASAKKPGPELTPAEARQLERFSDLYEEYSQQATEAQARLKVLQEMQQKLMSEFNSFQAGTIAARGYKSGEAVLDVQQRRVTPVPAKTDKPSVPSK